jgi:hypothetical protein
MSDCGSVALSEDRLPPCETIDPLCVTHLRHTRLNATRKHNSTAPLRRFANTFARSSPARCQYPASISMSGNCESVLTLGAQSSDIQKLILVRGVRLALLGIVFGVAGTVALAKSASSMRYGVTPADLSSLSGASLLLVFVALLACYVPARKAIRVDPLVALRHE